MILSEGLQFLTTTRTLLSRVLYLILLCSISLFFNNKIATAHTSSSCFGEGPFGLPGLDLPPKEIGQWGGLLSFPIQGTHSVVMSTGKVLFWRDALPPYLFDPASETFTEAESPVFKNPSEDLFCSGHATMSDGRIMIVGGSLAGAGGIGIPYTYIFDPITESWEEVDEMAESRWYPTLTTLLDGRLLVTSGQITPSSGNIATFPEIYDPKLGSWTTLNSAERKQRLYPFMYALPTKTLDAGPGEVYSINDMSTDPIWSRITGLALPSGDSGESSAMYRINQILKIGSVDKKTSNLDRALVLDMTQADPAWREVSPMNFPRRRADIILLPNGKVMISGGAIATQNDHKCAVHAAEIWDPETEKFTVVASQDQARIYHSSSVLLPDGRVLTTGGEGESGGKTAEIYSPPYLFKGARPIISDAPSVANYGSTFQVTTPDAAVIKSISVIRPAAITHNFDQNQRYLQLDFTVNEDQLSIVAPAANNTPPGDYMLFLVSNSGAVSVAEFIRLEPIDSDADGIFDHEDNCTMVANGTLILDAGNNAQLDTDNDGFGNICDADLNNDNIVNALDLGLFKTKFLTADVDADLNGDGIVNTLDLGLFKAMYFQPPGPAGPK